jgi:hypothetical protein
MSGTIFHRSPTNLRDWFYTIFLISKSKKGVAAKEIERQLGITYKAAWRIQRQIRKLMRSEKSILGGTIEIDHTLIGGKRKGKRESATPD